MPVRRPRWARRALWCVVLTMWLLAVMALGGQISPYSAPVSLPAASAPAATALPAGPPATHRQR